MIVLGAVDGHSILAAGVAMQPAPTLHQPHQDAHPAVILCTVVLGIARRGQHPQGRRVGGKAILYFEVVSTFARVIGLFMANFSGREKLSWRSSKGSKIGSRVYYAGPAYDRRGSSADDDS